MALGALAAITAPSLLLTTATPSLTETIAPQEDLFLYVNNASGGTITVTITDASVTQAGYASANSAVTVAAAAIRMIPIPAAAASTTTGLVTVTFSSVTSVTGAWIRI